MAWWSRGLCKEGKVIDAFNVAKEALEDAQNAMQWVSSQYSSPEDIASVEISAFGKTEAFDVIVKTKEDERLRFSWDGSRWRHHGMIVSAVDVTQRTGLSAAYLEGAKAAITSVSMLETIANKKVDRILNKLNQKRLEEYNAKYESRAGITAKGYVYFMRSELTGLIKIGYSVNPDKRHKSIQTSNGGDVTLLTAFKGTMADEQKLHEQFAESRVRGEWFTPTDELMKVVESYANEDWRKPTKQPAKKPRPKRATKQYV